MGSKYNLMDSIWDIAKQFRFDPVLDAKLFAKHKDSILMVSYSSNAIPTMEEMTKLLCKYKDNVEVYQIDHRYSFGNQGHKVGDNNNEVHEYIFVGY